MSLLLNQFNLSQLTSFRERIEASIVHTAIAVAFEDPSTPMHAQRFIFAQKVLNDAETYANLMVLGVADNQVIVNDFDGCGHIVAGKTEQDVTNDINFQVATIWNAYI